MAPAAGLSLIVGNDVVDIASPRTQGKSAEKRFLDRILDPTEQAYVAAALEPDLELWCLWAAKESCYKVASKVRGEPPVFEHAAFAMRWDEGDDHEGPGSSVRAGTVSWQDLACPVLVSVQPGRVHAVAHTGSHARFPDSIAVAAEELDASGAPWADELEVLLRRFTQREADAVHSRASAAVRLGARAALAEALNIEEARLEIVCSPGARGRRPPRLLLDGEAIAVDLSLSHDGAWIAWAWSAGVQFPKGR